jgi:hypothetical protein
MAAQELFTTPLYADAVWYARMEGNSNDSKSVLTPTDTNMAYGTAYGMFGQGALFNGASSLVSYADNAALDVGDYSISCWFYLNGTGAYQDIYSRQIGVGSNPNMYLRVTNTDSLQFLANDGLAGGFSVTAGSFGAGSWINFVGICDTTNNKAEMYINGTSIGTAANMQSNFNSNTPFVLGREAAQNLYYFSGQIDDFGFFNRVLTSTEAGNIYSGFPVSTGSSRNLLRVGR